MRAGGRKEEREGVFVNKGKQEVEEGKGKACEKREKDGIVSEGQ